MMRFHYLALAAAIASQQLAAAEPETEVVEFFHPQLEHYFTTGDAAEALAVDRGDAGPGWVRTGRSFSAWLHPENAPAGATQVCRFYSKGANSHFFTAEAAECAALKALEVEQRNEAEQRHETFTGWAFESLAFSIQTGTAGQCPSGTERIARLYNQGAATGEGSNHRFVNDSVLEQVMRDRGWSYEGVAFCAPVKASGTSAPALPSSGNFPEIATAWSGPSEWKFSARSKSGEAGEHLPMTLSIGQSGSISGTGNGCTLSGSLAQADGFRALFTGTLSVAACTDTRFNGSFPLQLERLGTSQLQLHVHHEDSTAELEIEALLASEGTTSGSPPPPPPPPALAKATAWSGTVAWVATLAQKGNSVTLSNSNHSLSLARNGTSLSGNGFGCAFSGTGAESAGVFTGTATASGCSDANFNGSYAVSLHSENGGALEVELEKEAETAQGTLKVDVRGRLAPSGA